MHPEHTRIPLTSLYNTRDLGGYKTKDGRTILPKKLIRSGALFSVTEEDINILTQEYQLKTIIDFRTSSEKEEMPDPVINDVHYIHNPILEDEQMGITWEGKTSENSMMEMMLRFAKTAAEDGDSFLAGIYPVFISDPFAISQYQRFFTLLQKQEDGAVLWHCSAGKDRVGVGTALLLSALGVDQESILQDYLATNLFIKPEIEAMKNKAALYIKDEKVLSALEILNRVKEEYLLSVFHSIDKNYGSVENFLEKQLKLENPQIESLRDKYLSKVL